MKIWTTIRPSLSRLVRFFRISLIEAKSERQSSYLGVFWGPLSTLLFTVILALVFKPPQVMSTSQFYLYVLAGYIMWNFIAASITSSTVVIQKRFDFAIHNNLTIFGLFYKLLIDRLFSLGMDLLLLGLALALFAPHTFGWHLLFVPPLILLFAFVSIAVAYIVNLTVILFPDLDSVFRIGVRFMFFASPIFWGAEGDSSGARAILIDYNPAAYYLSLFRQVFGIIPTDSIAWPVTLMMSIAICGTGWVAYVRSEAFVRNLK